MSTNLDNIKGVYKKVVNEYDAFIKFAYFADIKNYSNKLLQMRTIPTTTNAPSNCCLVSSTDDAQMDYERATLPNCGEMNYYTFTKLYQRPNVGTIPSRISNNMIIAPQLSTSTTFFISVLFEYKETPTNDVYLLYYEPVNRVYNGGTINVGPISLTSSSVMSLGNNMYVTKLQSYFTYPNRLDNLTLNPFSLPCIGIAKYVNNTYTVLPDESVFKLHDIAVCF